jgi:hypothetical protein
MIDEEEVEDALFWASLHRITRVEFKTIRQWLADGGHVPPANPADNRVSAELNTLLDRLAGLGVVVEFADHLSDRELYSWLHERTSRSTPSAAPRFLRARALGGRGIPR